MSAVIIVPFRGDDRVRVRNRDRVVAHLQQTRVADVLVIGDGRTYGPFNRSAAYNNGVTAYPDAKAWVFHEADMLIAPGQLREAIRMAYAAPGLVVPFDTYHYLSRGDSEAACLGASWQGVRAERVMADGRSTGAVNVVSQATMRAVGRWDETFEGWGYDDRAMQHAFEVATGSKTRFVKGPGVHLWHEPGWAAGGKFAGGSDTVSPANQRATQRNKKRLEQYRLASSAEQVRWLTAGG